MTIVKQILRDPVGAPRVGARVLLRLATNGYASSGQAEILSTMSGTADSTGLVSFDLTPQSQIDPLGTHYEWTNPDGEILSFTVPDGAGPFWLRNVLVSNPATPPAITAGVPLPAVPLTAGQLYGMDSTGNTHGYDIELAYAESVGGSSQTFTTSAVPVTGMVITVEPTDQAVWLELFGCLKLTGAPTASGLAFLSIYDITGGSPGTLVVSGQSERIISGTPAGTWTQYPAPVQMRYRVGPLTAAKVYSLSIVQVYDTGSSGIGLQLRNSATAPTYLAAVGR